MSLVVPSENGDLNLNGVFSLLIFVHALEVYGVRAQFFNSFGTSSISTRTEM